MQDLKLIWMGSKGKRVLLQLRIDVWNPGSRFWAWRIESNRLLLLWGVQCNNPTKAMLTLNCPNKDNPYNSIFPSSSTIILAKYKAKFHNVDRSSTNQITIDFYRQVWLDFMHFRWVAAHVWLIHLQNSLSHRASTCWLYWFRNHLLLDNYVIELLNVTR